MFDNQGAKTITVYTTPKYTAIKRKKIGLQFEEAPYIFAS